MKTSHILVLVCVALGGLVWLDNSGGPENPPSVPTRSAPRDASPTEGQDTPDGAPSGALAVGNPLATIDATSLSNTVNRPLFAPARSRPPVVSAATVEVAAPAPPPPPPSYALLGVVSERGRAIALLQRIADGTSFRVEAGDTIGGWRVANIEPKAVRLEREDGIERTVRLSEARPAPRANSAEPPEP